MRISKSRAEHCSRRQREQRESRERLFWREKRRRRQGDGTAVNAQRGRVDVTGGDAHRLASAPRYASHRPDTMPEADGASRGRCWRVAAANRRLSATGPRRRSAALHWPAREIQSGRMDGVRVFLLNVEVGLSVASLRPPGATALLCAFAPASSSRPAARPLSHVTALGPASPAQATP